MDVSVDTMKSLSKMDSLAKRLEGSTGALFAVRGNAPKGCRVIVPGVAEYTILPKWVTTQEPAYQYSNSYFNRTHSIPNVPKTYLEPPVSMVQFKPVSVKSRASIQKFLEDLNIYYFTGLQDYTGEFHFLPEERNSRIDQIYHQGIPHFIQDYVVRVYLKEGDWQIIWPREKVGFEGTITQKLISQY